MLPEIFGWNDPKSRFPFTFQLGFRETFCDGKQLRDGPLENLWGGEGGGAGEVQKNIRARQKIFNVNNIKNIHATA